MARAVRRTEANLVRVGDELRTARLVAGLTLAQVARASGISTTELSRIERGKARWVTIASLNSFAAAVGLDLWTKAYPGGEPLRDIAHLRLTDAFRALLDPSLVVRAEVPIGDPRDLRAWDLTVIEVAGAECGIELETRIFDAQDQLRRLHRKIADGGLDRTLLVVADTSANRSAIQVASGLLSTTFAIDDPAAYSALAEGRIPPRDALILVRVPGPVMIRGVPRSRPRDPGTSGRPITAPRDTKARNGPQLAPTAVRRQNVPAIAVGRDKT
jgi:transcriptional regulator with XRE-family HTH domain